MNAILDMRGDEEGNVLTFGIAGRDSIPLPPARLPLRPRPVSPLSKRRAESRSRVLKFPHLALPSGGSQGPVRAAEKYVVTNISRGRTYADLIDS